MARPFQPVVLALASLLTASALFFSACGDECDRKDDCATGEVCNAGVCEALSQGYVSCASDDDCDPNGLFVCRASRCTLAGTNQPLPMMDSGIIDTGVVTDAGAVDMGMIDSGQMDASTSTTGDAGMNIGDAGTSTVGDAGTSTTSDAG